MSVIKQKIKTRMSDLDILLKEPKQHPDLEKHQGFSFPNEVTFTHKSLPISVPDL